jgi:putative flippase GtrA
MLRKLEQWSLGPAHSTLLQVPRALLASALAAVFDLSLLVLLVEQGGWHPVAAALFSYSAGALLQYLFCAWWVFPHGASHAIGLATFMLLSGVGLGITWLTMTALHDWLRVNYILAKFVALGLAFTWNFLSRKLWIFKPICVKRVR